MHFLNFPNSKRSSSLQHLTGNRGMNIRSRKASKRLLYDNFFCIWRNSMGFLYCHFISTDEDYRDTIMGGNQRIDTRFAYNIAIHTHFPDCSWIVCVRQNGFLSADRAMVSYKTDSIKARIQAFHHLHWLVLTGNQHRLTKQILWMQVAHKVMR